MPPFIKICGITRPGDAAAAICAGADWLGFNFYPASPRFVEPALARTLLLEIKPPVIPIALFVHAERAAILDTANSLGISHVQLHDDQSRSLIPVLREIGLTVIQAVRLGRPSDVAHQLSWLLDSTSSRSWPDYVLLDAQVEGQFGGTGRTIPLETLDAVAALRDELPPLVLAGGLSPENVVERVALLKPAGVDVASGVESAPGRKDPQKLEAFIAATRGSRG
jgi:phosphoribosylanthranilate isomerase